MADIDAGTGAVASRVRPAAARRERGETLEARLRLTVRRVLREPLFHFFVVGLILFVLGQHHKAQTDIYRIEVTPDRVAKLSTDYRLQFGQVPSASTLDRLVDKFIDEEVLYREGLAMKLDRDDEIVRRRVVQKMQFLEQDLAAPAEPSKAELRRYYQSHLAQYVAPQRVSFSHIYFSPDKGGDTAARLRAEQTLAKLSEGVIRAPERGDSFPDLYDYADFGPDQAQRLFGDTDFARMLFKAPVGRWSGPFRSGYGWHLVYVQSAEPPRAPKLEEIHDQVRADLMADEQQAANRKAFLTLKTRFTIIRDDKAARP